MTKDGSRFLPHKMNGAWCNQRINDWTDEAATRQIAVDQTVQELLEGK